MNQYLFDKYSKDGEDAKNLLSQIEGISKIPYELLWKYYAKLYTIESNFYKNINKYLRKQEAKGLTEKNFIKQYVIPYIKILYEGIRLKCFKLCFNETLYRFQMLKKNEIQKIKEYLSNKKNGIPGAICFSKAFLSFTKDVNIANDFFERGKGNINDMNIAPFSY